MKCRWRVSLLIFGLLATQALSAGTVIRYFPSGLIYEYRWKLLALALDHTRARDGDFRLEPYTEDVTQNRGVSLLRSGEIDVIALGTDKERETRIRPVKIDISRGMIGFRIFVIRASDQARIAHMSDQMLRSQLTFGLNSQWADLPVLLAHGYAVETSSSYENLFGMLAQGRFDAFPRGLNEADRELAVRHTRYPQLAVEQTRALYFPFPIYFWVRKDNTALARRIQRGLELALADGSFKRLFDSYYASEIATMKTRPRHVIRLDNPTLPAGNAEPDTSWWWPLNAGGTR